MDARFLPLSEVAEALHISARQAYGLVHSGELPAIQVGGRGQWRVETAELEAYIQRKYAETRALVSGAASGSSEVLDVDGLDVGRATGVDAPGAAGR